MDILTLDGALAEVTRLEAVLDAIHERIHGANDGPLRRDIAELLADVIDCEACCDD